jgi:alkanesulfonate monooxygenase SsuD/methylene tetrahydromethanopterin reductase-like flavin-dependent oxidoreductase (luciferase family)
LAAEIVGVVVPRERNSMLEVAIMIEGQDGIDWERWKRLVRTAEISPRPSFGVPIVIGGNGPRRTLPLAARYADELNAIFDAGKVLGVEHSPRRTAGRVGSGTG